MFSKIFIDRPRLAFVVSIVMVLAGVISLMHLPVSEYPEIAPPSLYIIATYPGASAEELLQTVGIPLEDEINGVDDLQYFKSTASNVGSYTCEVTFKSGTDTDIAMVNLQNAVKRAEPKLPTEVMNYGVQVIKRGNDMLAVYVFGTDGSELSPMELNDYVDSNIKNEVARVDGVSSAEVMSEKEYSMRVWLNPVRMNGLDITVSDISSAIASQNVQAAAGSIGSENSNRFVSYKLNVKGRLLTQNEFENIVIRQDSDGSIVKLGDVARVEIGSSSYSSTSLFNGGECVGMMIYRTPEANAVGTIKRVETVLNQWKERFPAGVYMDVAYDPTEFINVSMREIAETLIIALLLVVLITWIFLQDWRATLIPSVAIPVSLLGTFPFMYVMGFSINVLTMFGLILVIGSLCDDAIVVVENAQTLMEREKLSPYDAAVKSMRQITGAIIATTLVTVACYAPLAFYQGMVGAIYRQFSVTMCISLCLSTVNAMTLSPALCATILRPPKEHPSLVFAPFNSLLGFSRRIYLFFVRFMVKWSMVTLILFAGVAVVTWQLFKNTDSSFIPEEDKGVIMCNIELPGGASVTRTEAVLEQATKLFGSMPGVKDIMAVSGMSLLSGSGENVGLCIAKLENWDKRKTPDLQIKAILGKMMGAAAMQIPDAQIVCFTPPAIMGLGVSGGVTFNLCAIGDETVNDLAKHADELTVKLLSRPDLTASAQNAFTVNSPQLFLEIDREKAETLGVNVSSIFLTLQSKLASLYVNDFTMNNKNYKVKIQSSRMYRTSVSNLYDISVPNNYGEMVPLTSVCKLHYMVGPKEITRFNKMICASFNAQTQPDVNTAEMFRLIENSGLPKNYHPEWTGLSFQERQNEGQIYFLLLLAFSFAYLFLVAQYESWTIPIPVMLTVLFAICGALIGLKIAGEPLSIYAQLGLVMLIGLTGKNAILMVEFSKQERESGKSIYDAAVRGGDLRYRAVLMTAWSFLFGVFPLVIATGAGSGSRRAIGIPTFAGMLLATIIGIIFTPALYAAFQRMREFVKKKMHWKERIVKTSES